MSCLPRSTVRPTTLSKLAALFVLLILATSGCNSDEAVSSSDNAVIREPAEIVKEMDAASPSQREQLSAELKRSLDACEYNGAPYNKLAVKRTGESLNVMTSSGEEFSVAPAHANGFRGNNLIDRESGKPMWPALTCYNAACSGRKAAGKQPFVFIQTTSRAANSLPSLQCPACGQQEHVHRYQTPESIQRRADLEAELVASRAARASSQAGDHRPPVEILREIATLPQLYLIEE